jgi:hypothetical protein
MIPKPVSDKGMRTRNAQVKDFREATFNRFDLDVELISAIMLKERCGKSIRRIGKMVIDARS